MSLRGRRRLPPPNWLRAFEAAARHLSFTAAARELHVTQSAVSQQVRLLEQYLHEPLFHRQPRKLQLTDTGEAYLATVGEAFEQLARGTAELFGQQHGDRVVLRVNPAFAIYWLIPRLKGFAGAHPQIDLRLNISVWLSDTEWDAVSLEIRYGRGGWSGVRTERLTTEQLFPVCAPALLDEPHAPALREPADLPGFPLLHVLSNNEGWSQWLEAAGVSDTDIEGGMQFDTSATALEYAAAGGGMALGITSLTRDMLASGKLIKPLDIEIPSAEGFHVVTPEARTDTRNAATVREWLLAQSGITAQTGDPR